MQLVADVGGTNARLALARGGALLPGSERRFMGDAHASFDEVLTLFLRDAGNPDVAGVCVAVAGPVSGGRAVLTNRAWDFSVPRLAQLTGAETVALINDLTALGHATASLTPRVLRPAPEDRPRNGQSLVVGAGTGFNVCAVRMLPGGGVMALESEEGHTTLPASIAERLDALLGPGSGRAFGSTEETFAGRGLARFHAARTGQPPARGENLTAAALDGDAEAAETFAQFAHLFGLLLRELAMRFMPREGLWLAGSVARSLIPWMDRITEGFLADPLMRDIPAATPLLLIEDDMAALQGCLNAITR